MSCHVCAHKEPENIRITFKVSKGPKKLTKSPDSCGISMFISEDLAVTMSALIESLLRYTIHPSVLSIDTVGTFPKTCKILSK